MLPKITLITVCYNAAATLRDTLESVRAQNYPALEYLIIDGGSTDGTLAILQEAQYASLITRYVSEPDKGIFDAMNKGIKMATGEIVGCLNADDYYATPTVLEEVATAFLDPTLDACYADLAYVHPTTQTLIRYWHATPFIPGAFARGWAPPHPTFFVRRRHALANLYDLNFKTAADGEWMMRLLAKNQLKSKAISRLWVHMRLGGVSNAHWRTIVKQNLLILKAHRKLGLPIATIPFMMHKLINRVGQYVKARSLSKGMEKEA